MSNRLISLRNYWVNQAGLAARNGGAIGGGGTIDNEELENLKLRLNLLEVNKADQSDLELKANQSDLELKADKNDTDSISNRVNNLELNLTDEVNTSIEAANI